MRENWTYKKLGEVATFKRGLTYSGKDEVSFSENVVLRSNNIDLATNTLNLDELKYISSDICIPEDKKLKANSIFMCMSNGSKQHLGKVAFIEHDMSYAFGGFMGLIIPEKEKICPKYLYFYFCSPQFKDVLSSIGNGANINNIKFVDIAKYSINIPSLSEQQSIVFELDKINELISQKKAQLSDLDSLAQSIFYDMFGDPIENEKGWEVKKLGEVTTFINGDRGKNYPSQDDFVDKGVPFINAGHIKASKIDFVSMNFITEDKYKTLNSGKIMDGDILFCLRGSLGKRAIVKGIAQGAIASSLVIIRCNDVNNQYLFHYLGSSFISSCIYKSNNGSSQPNLSATSVSRYIIPLPPLSLQQDFAKRIELIEQQKAQISSTIKDLETLLASRMQYWFD